MGKMVRKADAASASKASDEDLVAYFRAFLISMRRIMKGRKLGVLPGFVDLAIANATTMITLYDNERETEGEKHVSPHWTSPP